MNVCGTLPSPTHDLAGVQWACPGCSAETGRPIVHVAQVIDVVDREGKLHTGWKWNGSLESPTIKPSYLVHAWKRDGMEIWWPRCHSTITDGKIDFHSDCEHALKGTVVEMAPWSET